jgi:site-specific recombinase XerC
MAAIRMLFSWLTEKGVLAMNPAREVKTERFSRTEGKTPAFVDVETNTSAKGAPLADGQYSA